MSHLKINALALSLVACFGFAALPTASIAQVDTPTYDCVDEVLPPKPAKVIHLNERESSLWIHASKESADGPLTMTYDLGWPVTDWWIGTGGLQHERLNRWLIKTPADAEVRLIVQRRSQLKPKGYQFYAYPAYQHGQEVYVSSGVPFKVRYSLPGMGMTYPKAEDFTRGFLSAEDWQSKVLQFFRGTTVAMADQGVYVRQGGDYQIAYENKASDGILVACGVPQPHRGPPWHVHAFECGVKIPTSVTNAGNGWARIRFVGTAATSSYGFEAVCAAQNYVDRTSAHGESIMILDEPNRFKIMSSQVIRL